MLETLIQFLQSEKVLNGLQALMLIVVGLLLARYASQAAEKLNIILLFLW